MRTVQFVIGGMEPGTDMEPIVGTTSAGEAGKVGWNSILSEIIVSRDGFDQLHTAWGQLARRGPNMEGLDFYASVVKASFDDRGPNKETGEALLLVSWLSGEYGEPRVDVLAWENAEGLYVINVGAACYDEVVS